MFDIWIKKLYNITTKAYITLLKSLNLRFKPIESNFILKERSVQTMYDLLNSGVSIVFYVLAAVIIISAVVKLVRQKKNK